LKCSKPYDFIWFVIDLAYYDYDLFYNNKSVNSFSTVST